jgi:hypothetical protein
MSDAPKGVPGLLRSRLTEDDRVVIETVLDGQPASWISFNLEELTAAIAMLQAQADLIESRILEKHRRSH